MYKLYFAWLSLRKSDHNSDSPKRRDKILDTCGYIWSILPWSGRILPICAIALFFLAIVDNLFPAIYIYVNPVFYILAPILLISLYFFVKYSRNIELEWQSSDGPENYAKKVAELLLEHDICSPQEFDAVIEWCDQLIYPSQDHLNRFKEGGAIVLSYLIGAITPSFSNLPDSLFLPFVLVICVFVFVLVIAGVPEILFKILDKTAPIQMFDLQKFRRDLLMSKFEFMKLIRQQEMTKPEIRFYVFLPT